MVDSPILVMYIVVLQTSSNDEEAEDTMSVQNKQGEATPKFSRLKENLISLSSSSDTGACVVGKIANSLDEETRQAFFAVMASTASSNSIANTLRVPPPFSATRLPVASLASHARSQPEPI
jgi:hypothetical protein